MRNNVFEKIKISKMSISKSLDIILSEIFQHNNYEYISNLFEHYEYNYLYKNIKDLINQSFMFFDFSFRNINQWHLYIDDNSVDDVAISQIFDFFEHMINIIGIHHGDSCFERMLKVITKLVESLGYKLSEYEGKVVIIENDPIVENVITKLENYNTRKSIYEFLIARRKGDLINQKIALKELSEPIETLVKKYKKEYNHEIKNIFSNISEMLQCIRHDPEEKKKEKPFYYNDLEKWYDITFDQFLFVLGFECVLNGQKEFKYNSINIIEE